jgi:hypothetical protein
MPAKSGEKGTKKAFPAEEGFLLEASVSTNKHEKNSLTSKPDILYAP